MNSTSAVGIIKALPTCGLLLFIILGLCLSASPPTINIVHFGSTSFLVGYVIYVVVLILLTLSLGSVSALVRVMTPLTPSLGIYLFVIVIYGVTGFIWAAVSWEGVELTETLTAKNQTVLDGTFTSFYQHSARSKCYRTAVFATDVGPLEVCVGSSSDLVPNDLQMGEHVRLLGRRNNYVFVLHKVVVDS